MEKEKTLKAAIYVRSSTPGEKRETLENQAKRCKQKAKGEGYTIPADYIKIDSGVSGTTMNRPGFNRVMELAEAGKIQAVIVYKLNRFARNFIKSYEALQKLIKLGVVLVVAEQGWKFDGSKESNMIFGILGLVNEWILEDNKETILHNKMEGLEKGKLTQGKAKFGYDYITEKKAHTDKRPPGFHTNKKQKETYLKMVDLALEGLPLNKINVLVGKAAESNFAGRILKDKVYYTGDHPLSFGGEVFYEPVEAFIKEERWNQLKKALDKRKPNKNIEAADPFKLRLTCYCKCCEKDLPLKDRLLRAETKMVKGKPYPYYTHKCPEYKDGKMKLIPLKDGLEDRAIEGMIKHLGDNKNPEMFSERYQQWIKGDKIDAQLIEQNEKENERDRKELQKINELRIDSGPESQKMLKERAAAIEERIAKREREIKALRSNIEERLVDRKTADQIMILAKEIEKANKKIFGPAARELARGIQKTARKFYNEDIEAKAIDLIKKGQVFYDWKTGLGEIHLRAGETVKFSIENHPS